MIGRIELSGSNIQLGTEFCEEAFPLHLILDEGLNILHVSNGLQKLISEIEIGLNFQNFLIEEKTAALLEAGEIQDRIRDGFIFVIKKKPDFRLHCGFYPIANGSFLLVCTPIISNSSDIKKFALNFDDFSRHDPILNHISVVQTKESAFNDIHALVDNLEVQVEERTRELSESMQEAVLANRAKSEFLSSMSHELRTPMNAILGFGQLLKFNPKQPLTDEQKISVDQVLSSGNHLLELIIQVLDLAKIETGKLEISLEKVTLEDVCEECLELISKNANDRGLSVDGDLSKNQSIMADYTRIKQILLNLLSNAVKYNREGGNIILISKNTPDNKVRISVTDNGHGIADVDQAGLFEPFNRLGRDASAIEGTGIGLTITKQLVEAMGGNIGFTSEVGIGSTFWIEFPSIESLAVVEKHQQENCGK